MPKMEFVGGHPDEYCIFLKNLTETELAQITSTDGAPLDVKEELRQHLMGKDKPYGTTPLSCWTFPARSSLSPRSIQPPEHWLDLRHIVDPDDTRFDDIEFARWESDSMLLRGCDTEDGRWKEVRVSMEQLKAEML